MSSGSSKKGLGATLLLKRRSSTGDAPEKGIAERLGVDRQELLRQAVNLGNRKMLQHLISKGVDLNVPDDRGWRPLHVAARRGDLEMILILMGSGADPTLRDHRGRDAMDIAYRNGHEDALLFMRGVALKHDCPDAEQWVPGTPASIALDPEILRKVDRHAIAAPAALDSNLHALVDYLVAPWEEEPLRCRTLFRWICDRIRFDAVSYFDPNRYYSELAHETFYKSRGVCAGYAHLFMEMATLAGLQAQYISGYSKGYDFEPTLEENRHAWNGVQLNGAWYLLDATWCAGSLDDERRVFVKQFSDEYYLMEPRAFVLNHLPLNDRWQLLPDPVSQEAFLHGPNLRPRALELDFHPVSHPCVRLVGKPGQIITLTFRSGVPDLQIDATLQMVGKKKVEDFKVRTESGRGNHRVICTLPQAGEYWLWIAAGRKVEPMQGVQCYVVAVVAGSQEERLS